MGLSYCPPGMNLSTVWEEHGFAPCFLGTLEASVLSGVMAIFGTFEIIMYWRFGSHIDSKIKEYKFFYAVQLCAMILLMFIPAIRLALDETVFVHASGRGVYGYLVFVVVASFAVWFMSIVIVRMERNYDLPTPPVYGHSVVLLIFWTLALVFDVLEFVDISARSWINQLDHVRTATMFALLILHFLCVLTTFVLGIKAPGIPSMQQRFLSMYHTLPDTRKAKARKSYGSMDTNNSAFNLDVDLPESLAVLETQLQSGEAQRQFDAIPRQKAGLKSMAASRPENRAKNRHLNILAYDVTRVILQESPEGGTYINASRLNIFLPNSDVGRNYIATQAPLPNTVGDFWQMIYENLCGLIISLCNLSEKGTQACVQYWPNATECAEYGKLVVTCTHESTHSATYFHKKAYVVREFSIFNLETQQELNVTQYHLLTWVPEVDGKKSNFKPGNLVDFIHDVRSYEGMCSGPDVVHCSNGVDRTGAYILADLGQSLIDNDQPVRPTELLRQLRMQRPGMVSKYADYQMACNAILTAYQRIAKRLGYPVLKGKY